jgi:hypothetical protein
MWLSFELQLKHDFEFFNWSLFIYSCLLLLFAAEGSEYHDAVVNNIVFKISPVQNPTTKLEVPAIFITPANQIP